MACSRIGNTHPIVARSNTVKLKTLCKNLKTPRVDGLWVCWVDGVLSPNSTEELRIESSAQSKALAHVDLSSSVASVGWLDQVIPLDLKVLRTAPWNRHNICRHFRPKVRALQSENASIVVPPAICRKGDRTETEQGSLAIKQGFMVRICVATLV